MMKGSVTMSIERARAYLKEFEMEERIMELAESSATVELAAEALHCEPERIAKTLSFLVGEQPILIVAAGDARIDKVYNLLSQRSPLSTWLQVKTAGTVQIILDIEVTGRKSYKTAEIQQQILTALYNAYSPEKSTIGGSVRISDIYALIDNCSMVDYLHIKKFYTKPWPNTIYGNRELLINNFKLEKATGSNTYFITFSNNTEFRIRAAKGGFDSTGRVGNSSTYQDADNDVTFSFGVADNGYQNGFRYSITISEPNMDYEDPGFNIPVFSSNSQLTLTVKETI